MESCVINSYQNAGMTVYRVLHMALRKWSFQSLKKNKKIEEGKKKKVAATCQQYLTKYKEQNFHKFYIGEKWYLFSLKIERIQKSEFKASTNGIWYQPIRQTCKKETNVAMTSNKMFQVVWWSKILGFSSKELLRKKNILNFLLSTTSTWHFPQNQLLGKHFENFQWD